jgi:hypothetical protein
MPGFKPICLRNKEGITTQPFEETVTIAEFKVTIITSKRYTLSGKQYNAFSNPSRSKAHPISRGDLAQLTMLFKIKDLSN